LERKDIKELHYITPIANVPSIMRHGILSNELSKRLPHESLAMDEVQVKRRNKSIPGARRLHEYAPLYFDAHNPMLSKRRSRNDQICILCVNPSVLDLPGVIISDQNAASNYVRFFPAEAGLATLDKDRIFATFWLHPDNQIEEWAHSSIKCAEVLIPDRVEPKYVIGAYVANQTALKAFKELNIQLTVCIKNGIFF
jgi:hypothetical protein